MQAQKTACFTERSGYILINFDKRVQTFTLHNQEADLIYCV